MLKFEATFSVASFAGYVLLKDWKIFINLLIKELEYNLYYLSFFFASIANITIPIIEKMNFLII